ncbi:hypothetical protein EJ04DRAFT_65449 [Polyplosphaeria fusca]|uniref:Uncharacterized protein n=1 Tax=Polyplosphaeria fusca TaxID=682080 RepID=A0A9P4QLK4_9PLEO|nr:hypothetical protein EJ04DRAFT_65449 [Polyplosphaeria fusca]
MRHSDHLVRTTSCSRLIVEPQPQTYGSPPGLCVDLEACLETIPLCHASRAQISGICKGGYVSFSILVSLSLFLFSYLPRVILGIAQSPRLTPHWFPRLGSAPSCSCRLGV